MWLPMTSSLVIFSNEDVQAPDNFYFKFNAHTSKDAICLSPMFYLMECCIKKQCMWNVSY